MHVYDVHFLRDKVNTAIRQKFRYEYNHGLPWTNFYFQVSSFPAILLQSDKNPLHTQRPQNAYNFT